MSVYSDHTYQDTSYFDIFEFLSEYKKHPCLWDPRHENFKDRPKRITAESILGAKMGIQDLKMLRKKIRSVRGTYNCEVRKIKSAIMSGNEYLPKLCWFHNAHEFLKVTTGIPAEAWHIEKLDETLDNEEYQEEYLDIGDPLLDHDSEFQDDVPNVSSPETTIRKKQKSVRKSYPARLHETENEFHAFGNSIALQLQNMPLELALQLQSDIQIHITKKRLEYIRKCQDDSS